MLSEFAQPDKTLTISDIIDMVIPRLLNIPEGNCSQMTLRRLQKFKIDLKHIKDHLNRLKVLEGFADEYIKDLLRQIPDASVALSVFSVDSRYW